MTKKQNDSQELAKSRAQLYHIQAGMYSAPPDTRLLKLLAEWVHSQVHSDSISQWLTEPVKASLRTMDGFFSGVTENAWKDLEKTVAVEHTRLFRGVRQSYSPPPPYESVYTEENGRVFGDVSIEVQSFYRQFGLDLKAELTSEPPDHLSFELDFMHFVCLREAQAWEEADETEALKYAQAQRDFLNKHLLTWLPEFCAKVREFDRLGLFRGLADFTESWAIFDFEEHLTDV